MIHRTAKVYEQVNRKCRLGTLFYNFQPLHLPISSQTPYLPTTNVNGLKEYLFMMFHHAVNLLLSSKIFLWHFSTSICFTCHFAKKYILDYR